MTTLRDPETLREKILYFFSCKRLQGTPLSMLLASESLIGITVREITDEVATLHEMGLVKSEPYQDSSYVSLLLLGHHYLVRAGVIG